MVEENKKKIMFLDLEWDQKRESSLSASDSLIEVGATILEGGEKIDSFFSYVRSPEKIISTSTLNILGITPGIVMGAPNIRVVGSRLEKYSQGVDFVVVWSEASKLAFELLLKNFCDLRDIPFVVIQEDIGKLINGGAYISMDKAMIRLFDEYNPCDAHNAKYDSECLSKLYKMFYEEYDQNNLDTLKEKWNNGEKGLKEIKIIRACKGKAVSPDFIGNIANYFGFEWSVTGRYIYIYSSNTAWRLTYDGKYVCKVMHQNYTYNTSGFHEHDIIYKDVFSVLLYIYGHEKIPYKNYKINEDKKKKKADKKKAMQKERRQLTRIYREDFV